VLIGLGSARPPAAADIAQALDGAVRSLGQRPAITFLTPRGRQEQGLRSLGGWVAKGAHLLRDEFGLRPGDSIGVSGPAGWPLATVCLAAWWNGLTVSDPADTHVAVLHVGATAPSGSEVLWLGDDPDGSAPTPDGRDCWTEAVLPYPDRAPAPAATTDAIALRLGTATFTHAALLALAGTPPDGVVGLRRAGRPDVTTDAAALAALTLRPLVTGAAIVVVDDADMEPADAERAVAAERVTAWLA